MTTTRKRRAVTPRITTKTITAKALLLEIKRLVLAEPKRANLDTWVYALNGRLLNPRRAPRQLPACGTVACLAGWGAVLLRPDRADAPTLFDTTEHVMTEYFDVDVFEDPLFTSCAQRQYGETEDTFGNPGTRQHAQTIAKRIDQHLARHPELATKVIDVAEARRRLAARESGGET